MLYSIIPSSLNPMKLFASLYLSDIISMLCIFILLTAVFHENWISFQHCSALLLLLFRCYCSASIFSYLEPNSQKNCLHFMISYSETESQTRFSIRVKHGEYEIKLSILKFIVNVHTIIRLIIYFVFFQNQN